MRKRKLSQDFSVYNTANNDLIINGSDFANTVSKFVKEHLTGAAEIEIIGESDGVMSISPTHTAHLIKMIVSCAKANEIVKMKIILSNKMELEATFENLPTADKLAKIIKFATSCLFDVKRSGDSIVFATEIKYSEILKIYAVSLNIFEEELKNAFICKQ